MRFLKLGCQDGLSLTEDLIDDIPKYAILSHTWGADIDEVTFADLRDGLGRDKMGYTKIKFCGQQARQDGIEYFWVDTCCIDKANNNELSEAINSMFRWYSDSVKCYVYLSDVSTCVSDSSGQVQQAWEADFRASRWFTRGWTLQELLAPPIVEFFSREKKLLGDKKLLVQQIHEITDIPIAAIYGTPLQQFSVSERRRWASKRKTKRKEDQVYCLLGIFGVFMPLIYGEGENALLRLQEEILRRFGPDTALPKESKRLDSNPSIVASTNEGTALRAETRILLNKEVNSIRHDGRRQIRQPCQQQCIGPQTKTTPPVSMDLRTKLGAWFKLGKFCNGCRLTERSSIIRFGDSSLLFRKSRFRGQDCAIHRGYDVSRTTVKYWQRVCLLSGKLEVMFLFVLASGFPSIGISLRLEARCKVLPLSSFFRKLYYTYLYRKIRLTTSPGSFVYPRKLVSKEKQDYLLSVARKQILQAYQSGSASPQDVDRTGKNLLHVRAFENSRVCIKLKGYSCKLS